MDSPPCDLTKVEDLRKVYNLANLKRVPSDMRGIKKFKKRKERENILKVLSKKLHHGISLKPIVYSLSVILFSLGLGRVNAQEFLNTSQFQNHMKYKKGAALVLPDGSFYAKNNGFAFFCSDSANDLSWFDKAVNGAEELEKETGLNIRVMPSATVGDDPIEPDDYEAVKKKAQEALAKEGWYKVTQYGRAYGIDIDVIRFNNVIWSEFGL